MNITDLAARLGRGSAVNARRGLAIFRYDVPTKERLARLAATLVGLWIVGGIVLAVRRILWALLAAWLITAAHNGRTADAQEQPEEEPAEQAVDIVAHLLELSDGTHNVLLTRLQEVAGLPDTKAVRQLLEEAGVPTRVGVRAPDSEGVIRNGPGVHLADVPSTPLSDAGGHGDGCCCRSDANTNANNGPEEGTREGFRVEPIGQAGTVVHDPAEAHRHQKVHAN